LWKGDLQKTKEVIYISAEIKHTGLFLTLDGVVVEQPQKYALFWLGKNSPNQLGIKLTIDQERYFLRG